MAATSGVKLAWARDRDGLRVAAAALDPRRRRERAPFACPACGEEVLARLGPMRARHFAHRPGSRCPLTAPETALHLDAKLRLLDLCREAGAVITTAETAIFDLLHEAATPEFKKVSPLVR